MAQAGKARGASVGGTTQARRAALQQEKKQRAQPWVEAGEPASLHGLVNRLPDADKVREAMGLGPAGGVELRSALEDLQAHERQREHQFDLPAELAAMQTLLEHDRWQAVLEARAMRLVGEEAIQRHAHETGLPYQRGYQAAQWSGEQVKANGTVLGAEQQIKERAHELGLIGGAEPAPQVGVWAELGNLRDRVLKVHQVAQELAERLGGVLVPTQEDTSPRPEMTIPFSRLSADIQMVAVDVVRVQDLLEGLLGRLDL